MFSSRSVQIAAVFSDVFGKALPNLCRSFYNETKAEMFFSVFAVALLAEGVDRNLRRGGVLGARKNPSPSSRRAWIEMPIRAMPLLVVMSPSSRRAWIEIAAMPPDDQLEPSPSSRRAWIEIAEATIRCRSFIVALLAEGVDRNIQQTFEATPLSGRPPRGGRG